MVVGFLLENWLDTPLELIVLDEGYRGNPSGAKNTGKVRNTETNLVESAICAKSFNGRLWMVDFS